MRVRLPRLSLAARQRIAALLVLWMAYIAGRHDGYQRAMGTLYTSYLRGFIRGASSGR